ncbi:hypothetical protein C8R44DRAFT_761229 [Mycena epipterygia]|nr:hypothetical protein C8R44DRAFT_761229 [Mycena epipterygia]
MSANSIPDPSCIPGGSSPPGVRDFSETARSTSIGSCTVEMGPHLPPLKLVPISPECSQRYDRRTTVERRRTEYAVNPLSRSFLREPPVHWSAHRHPEGGLYFAHDQQGIFTDSDLYDTAILAQITSVMNQLSARPEVHQLLSDESSHIDIVLNLMRETPENDECGYYLVDHSARIIFWLDVFNMSALTLWRSVPGPQTPSHVKLCLEIQYWLHCDYFPAATVSISASNLQELRGAIMFSIADSMTSPTTNFPFPIDHMFHMLELTKAMSNGPTSRTGELDGVKIDDGSMIVLTRFMKQFAIERFTHFHGERIARRDKSSSAHGETPQHTYVIIGVSLVLFNAPLDYLRTIEAMYMDGTINYMAWYKLITKLRSEWHEFILYGTLLLNINVGFLAIPMSGSSGAAQLASYVSICFGLGTIILGLILLRFYPNADNAVMFFGRNRGSAHRLEALSIVYSLPYGLTIWSMITFILGFLIAAFQRSSPEMRGVILPTIATVCLAILRSIWTQSRL